MKELIRLTVNGEIHEFAVEPQTTLLEALRDELKLTGAKEGCGTGECGTCTVLLDNKPFLSCLTLAVDCQDAEVMTIEGLAEGNNLTNVQQSFLEKGAVQCGFCTPGMVLTITALLKEIPKPTDAEIKRALEGNICRCTGYNKIVEAIAATVERTK